MKKPLVPRSLVWATVTLAVLALLALDQPSAQAVQLKLSGTLVANGNVTEFQISPDGAHVVYVADQEVDERFELYSVAMAGSAPVKLNGPLVPDGDVAPYVLNASTSDPTFLITPDSSTVIYRADQDIDGKFELFQVPIAGGTPVRVQDLVPDDWWIYDFQITNDGTYVVYEQRPPLGPDPMQLHATALDGSVRRRLDADQADEFKLSSDSARAVYRAYSDPDAEYHLYSVPITGGTPTPLYAAGDVGRFWQISPAGNKVGFNVGQSLYLVPIEGGALQLLDGATGLTNSIPRFTDNGAFVTYRALKSGRGTLRSVPTAGGTPVTVAGPISFVQPHDVSVAHSRLIYSHCGPCGPTSLFSVPFTGGPATQLSDPAISGGSVLLKSKVTPDEQSVIYLARLIEDGDSELYIVPVTGGPSTKLNHPFDPGETIPWLLSVSSAFSPNGEKLVYLAGEESPQHYELFIVPLAGGAATQLGIPVPAGRSIETGIQMGIGGQVVFRANLDTESSLELYVVDLGNCSAPAASPGGPGGFRSYVTVAYNGNDCTG